MMKLVKDSKGDLGCDISYYQGKVDFEKMKKAGIKFVIIRAGFGQTLDKNFITYINGAIKAGLKVGVYWFIYAKDAQTAKLNAIKMMSVIETYKDKIICGVWGDWEYDSERIAGPITVAQRCAIVKAFLDTLEAKGYEVGIYSNQDYIKSGKFSSELVAAYPLWFAKYSETIGYYSGKGKNGQAYLWQYTSSGNGKQYGVSSEKLDMDLAYFVDANVGTDTVLDKVQNDTSVIKASDNPWSEPTRTIFYNPKVNKYIMRGDDVKWVQWHLWRLGMFVDKNGNSDSSKIDGLWGKESDKVFAEFQEKEMLLKDRKCGPISRDKMKMLLYFF